MTNSNEHETEQNKSPTSSSGKKKFNLKLLIYLITPVILVPFLVLVALYFFLGEKEFYTLLSFNNGSNVFDESQTVNLVEIPELSTRIHETAPDKHVIKISIFLDLHSTFVPDGKYIPGCTSKTSLKTEPDSLGNTKATTFEECIPFITKSLKQMFAGINKKNIYIINSLIPIKEKITILISKIIYPLQIRAVFIRHFSYSG